MIDCSFPLKDVSIQQKEELHMPRDNPNVGNNCWVNKNEFYLEIKDIGNFYARDGSRIEFSVSPGADHGWVRLCLNGQMLVAILHQRKIISFHSSSFIFNKRGVMILGESGTGKSSLTTAFVVKDAGLLTDDITPIIFNRSLPFIWPLHEEIRLKNDTILQLGLENATLRKAEKGTDKQYLDVGSAGTENIPLHTIFKIEIGDVGEPKFEEPLPAEKFSLLRSEICMWETIAEMPGTESDYLNQVLQIIKQVSVIKVIRPATIKIKDLHSLISVFLNFA